MGLKKKVERYNIYICFFYVTKTLWKGDEFNGDALSNAVADFFHILQAKE